MTSSNASGLLAVRLPNGSFELASACQALAVSRANHLFFLGFINMNNIEDMIREGVMIGAGIEPMARIDAD